MRSFLNELILNELIGDKLIGDKLIGKESRHEQIQSRADPTVSLLDKFIFCILNYTKTTKFSLLWQKTN